MPSLNDIRTTFLDYFDQNGHEVVACVAGALTLHQDRDGEVTTVTLGPGEYVVNDPGVWHTADVDAPATAVFITAGVGTDVRPR